jgi:hypothetical protein
VSAPTIQNDVIISYWPKQRHVLLLFSTPKLCKTKVSRFLPALRYCSYSPHRYALRGLFFNLWCPKLVLALVEAEH